MKVPKHYKLVKEHPNSYEIHDERDDKRFHVAKRDLNLGMHVKLAKLERYAEGGEVDDSADSGSADPQPDGAQSQPPVTVNVNAAPAGAPAGEIVPPASSAPALPPEAPVVSSPIGAPAGPVVAPRQPTTAAGQLKAGVAQQQQGLNEQADAEVAQKQKEAEALSGVYGPEGQMQGLMAKFEQSRKALDDENQSLTKSVLAKEIDPNRWFNSKDALGKIKTGIAVILGGIGQGLSHSNTNQALALIQDQIKNDIDAQKAELGKKTTLLSLNMQKYRNLDAATQATMQQMTAMVQGQIQLSAAQSGSQMALARAKIASGQLAAGSATELPKLLEADAKMSALHELNGTQPPPSGASHVLNNSTRKPGSPEQETPASPVGRTGLLDMRRFNLYQVAGTMPKEDVAAATKEAGEFQESQATKALLVRDFQQMQDAVRKTDAIGTGTSLRRVQEVLSKAPMVGGMVEAASPWGGEAGRQYAAAKASATNKINTLLTKRIGGEAMKNIALDLPTGQESSQDEVNEKINHVMDLIDSNSKTPTLDRYKLIR